MSIKNEVDIIRKENLKLNKKDTKLVFETLMKVYKSKIVNEARNIMGYTLDVVVANMNGFNRLGNSQNIYQKWGDNFYIDFYNSVFCKEEVDENGDLVSNKSEAFSEINELDSIKNISFSLKEIILICKQNNIDIKDLKVSAMKVPSMNDALKSNQIDGMLTYEPFVTTAVENGNTELVDSSEIIPGHPCCVVAASDDFLKEHPDEAKKIVEIHANATKYVQEHPDDAVSQLPKDIVANPDIEKKSLSGINFVSGLDDAYKQNVMDFMNIEVDLGVLKEKIPADKIFYDVTA